jgi:hypothetical protein
MCSQKLGLTFNRWIILIHEVTLYQLDGKA